jgi:dihydroneopterin aldolase
MLDVENLIDLLREAIEEQEWDLVEQVLEKLTEELDNPFDEYESNKELDW